jgi:O-antigen ligase
MALAIGLGMVANLDLRRRQMVVSVIALSALLVTMAVPSFWDVASERYIYKSSKQGQGVFYTREQVWEISKENALAGGWLGAGYGVSIGENEFAGGLTAVGYGREKGNTQMAIMEETGLVGLGLYAAFLIVLFRRMLRLFLRVGTRDERVLLGIVIGTLVGLTVQGIFEAWWVAPGSPEAAYWWAFVGVASGVSLALERRAQHIRMMARASQSSAVLLD